MELQLLTLLGLSSFAIAQNGTRQLINPVTRFDHLNLTFPEFGYPILHTDFEVRPDCGEESYVGHGRLQGRHALITGGDSGIGRAIAIAYAREGATVAINYLPEEEPDAQDLADFLGEEFPDRPLIRIPGDLLNETFCTELVHEARRRLGGLDIVVNNAGYGGIQAGPDFRNISQHTTEQFDRVFKVNLYASFFITRAAVPLLPPGSSLLYTVSPLAVTPLENALDYQASKAALRALLQGVAMQVGPLGIRVNGVAPGLTYTPFPVANGDTVEDVVEFGRSLPLGRLTQPVELSPLYVSLADDAFSYTSGSVFGAHGARSGVW